jgi:hypothetical protein
VKTIDIPRKVKSVNERLDQARDEDVVIRAADGTEFLVTQLDDFEEEIAPTRRNKKLMAFLEARAKETETISFEEVQRRLGLASSKRRAVPAESSSRGKR